jgi:spermidine synthase
VALAVSRLERFPALTSLDAAALRRGAVLPHAVRTRRR